MYSYYVCCATEIVVPADLSIGQGLLDANDIELSPPRAGFVLKNVTPSSSCISKFALKSKNNHIENNEPEVYYVAFLCLSYAWKVNKI